MRVIIATIYCVGTPSYNNQTNLAPDVAANLPYKGYLDRSLHIACSDPL